MTPKLNYRVATRCYIL